MKKNKIYKKLYFITHFLEWLFNSQGITIYQFIG